MLAGNNFNLPMQLTGIGIRLFSISLIVNNWCSLFPKVLMQQFAQEKKMKCFSFGLDATVTNTMMNSLPRFLRGWLVLQSCLLGFLVSFCFDLTSKIIFKFLWRVLLSWHQWQGFIYLFFYLKLLHCPVASLTDPLKEFFRVYFGWGLIEVKKTASCRATIIPQKKVPLS